NHQRNIVFLGEFDRTRMHDGSAGAGELEHFVVADRFEFERFRDEPRVGGVDAVDVGVDFASHISGQWAVSSGQFGGLLTAHCRLPTANCLIVLEYGGEGDGSGVGAAAA